MSRVRETCLTALSEIQPEVHTPLMYPRLRPFPEIDRPWVTGMYGSALADIQIDQIVDTSKDQGLLLTPSQLQINVEEMSHSIVTRQLFQFLLNNASCAESP